MKEKMNGLKSTPAPSASTQDLLTRTVIRFGRMISAIEKKNTDACNLGFYVCERNCVEVIGNIFDNADLLEVER